MSNKRIARALLCLMVVVGCSATIAMGENILFIVNDPTEATFQNDALIKNFLESLGHTVTYFDDDEDEATTEAAAAAADLVYISESVGSGAIRDEITEIETPMIVGEPYAWDEMGMTLGGGGTSDVATTDITIVSPGHFLAAGLSGTVSVLTDIAGTEGTAQFAMGDVGGDGTAIATATLADGQTYDVIVVYEKGAKLAMPPTDGSPQIAADVRIGMFFHYYAHDVLNDNAYALIGAAVKYVLGSKPHARTPNPPDGSLYPDTWANLTWSPGDFAASHDVYLGESFDEVNDAAVDSPVFVGNQVTTSLLVGFPGFPYPDGLVPGTTYYWRVDEINDTEPNSPWKGPVWSFSIPPKTAYNPKPTDGAESVALDAVLTWTAGFGAKLHTVYFGDNFDDVNNAVAGAPQGIARYNPGPLELAKTYYWRVDEFDAVGTHKGNVWSFTTEGAAAGANPANGAVNVSPTPTLKWSPGNLAASHEVYFGADADAVKNAAKTSPEYKGTKALGDESYDAGRLELETTYYWRVDEVNSTQAGSPWVGKVWSFTTGAFLVVDDFESYNDIDPPDPASNRIFEAWIDGFGTTNNGALVGNDMPPYAEQTVVHSGSQSMPYAYDNNLKTSEATMTLVYPRDWTEEGVAKLSLWLRGTSANSAERTYIALNGTAVVYHDDAAATQKTGWNQWVIDLQAFADQGVNLASVNTITIGIGTKNSPAAGGTGTMYFDDIRLYR
ncbi:MAG: hypothetical protein ABIF19_06130 [Planctomycetota bacterium]